MITGLSEDGITNRRHRDHRRSVLDASGNSWQVYERNAAHEPGARAERCLIFESERAWRRAWQYPVDWEALSEAELRTIGRID